MANKYYELIKEPQVVIDGKVYETQKYDMGLGEFLREHYMKKLLIFEPSIMSNKIEAIVL